MAFARDVYTATASQTDFTITFPYEATADVTVFQNGTQLNTTQFSLPNATTVRLVTGATSGDAIVLERNTSRSTRSVDFTPGTLTESDLDGSAIQTFYMAQEAIDQVALGLKKASDEIWDATSTRIKNVADGTGDNDAVNLAQMNTAIAVATLGSLPSPLTVALGGTGGATALAARSGLGVPQIAAGKTTAPTTTDDTSSGYVVGDIWVDETNNVAYCALDVTASAAVWARIYGTVAHNFAATVPPDADDDVTNNYGPGSIWVDVTNDLAYICVDGTDTAAVWLEVTAGSSRRDNYGFSLTNNGSDAAHDLDIGAGGVWDSTGVHYFTVGALTKQLDAAWAAGTNAGCWDTGTPLGSADVPVYLYAIRKDSDGTGDILASLSATLAGATLPSGYTYGRRIGAVPIDPSNNILGFTEIDGFVTLNAGLSAVVDTGLTTTMTAKTVKSMPRNVMCGGIGVLSASTFQTLILLAIGPAAAAGAGVSPYSVAYNQYNAATASTLGTTFVQQLDASRQLSMALTITTGTHTATIYVHWYYQPDRFEE